MMAKAAPKPHQSRSRSVDEMRAALAAFITGDEKPSIPPNYDAPAQILEDAINELLANRQTVEDLRAFVQTQSARLARK